jgi:hypothetical protein
MVTTMACLVRTGSAEGADWARRRVLVEKRRPHNVAAVPGFSFLEAMNTNDSPFLSVMVEWTGYRGAKGSVTRIESPSEDCYLELCTRVR